jgi:hypothetical protein
LLDPIFNTYNNLSLGQFLNNRLNFDQFMVNPDLYEYFVVSEEPLNDRESRISNIIAGGTRVDIVPNDTVVGGVSIQRVIKDRTFYFSILLSNNFMYLAWASTVLSKSLWNCTDHRSVSILFKALSTNVSSIDLPSRVCCAQTT